MSRVVGQAWVALALALGLVFGVSPGFRASRARGSGHASASSTSRWWELDCGQRRPGETAPSSACVFNVRVRGRLDRSRLGLVEQAIRRRDESVRALGRDVVVRIDADSEGGEIFAAMEIGRLLRREGASLRVDDGASCISACVFVLMGAAQVRIADGARVGMHRPSLGPRGRDPRIDSMKEAIALYADEMHVSRRMVDDMMLVPADRIRLLRAADLAGYGIRVSRG